MKKFHKKGFPIIKIPNIKILWKLKDSGEQVYVFNFVLRDSKIDFINVTCWGNRSYIDDLLNQINIASKPSINNSLIKI